MATILRNEQTLAGMIFPGDIVLLGERPDDFATVVRRDERPGYIKLTFDTFDHTPAVARIRRTDIVHILRYEEIAEEEEVMEEVDATE